MGNDFDATRIRKRGLGALAILASLALGSAPAQAQICGDPNAIAEDLLDAYLDELGDYFELSPKACDSMSDAFSKTCMMAVKDAVKCGERQIEAIPKAAEPACEETAKNPASCIDDFDDEATAARAALDEDGETANGECAVATLMFFEQCTASL